MGFLVGIASLLSLTAKTTVVGAVCSNLVTPSLRQSLLLLYLLNPGVPTV